VTTTTGSFGEAMQIKNAHPDHIGLATFDENVNHTRWPCISHPPGQDCLEAQRIAGRRGLRTLQPAPAGVRAFPAPQQEVT
jgi:hypothetical protein